MKIKTIDINAKEWFDKVNGNSYFSATITLNFGMKRKIQSFVFSQGCNVLQDAEKIIELPFQYGYGDHYVDMANDKLIKKGFINGIQGKNIKTPLWRYCEDNNIILRNSIQRGCKKRELNAV